MVVGFCCPTKTNYLHSAWLLPCQQNSFFHWGSLTLSYKNTFLDGVWLITTTTGCSVLGGFCCPTKNTLFAFWLISAPPKLKYLHHVGWWVLAHRNALFAIWLASAVPKNLSSTQAGFCSPTKTLFWMAPHRPQQKLVLAGCCCPIKTFFLQSGWFLHHKKHTLSTACWLVLSGSKNNTVCIIAAFSALCST